MLIMTLSQKQWTKEEIKRLFDKAKKKLFLEQDITVSKEDRAEAKAFINRVLPRKEKNLLWSLASFGSTVEAAREITGKTAMTGNPGSMAAYILSGGASSTAVGANDIINSYVSSKTALAVDKDLHRHFDDFSIAEREGRNPEEAAQYAATMYQSAGAYLFQRVKLLSSSVMGVASLGIIAASAGSPAAALIFGSTVAAASVPYYFMAKRLKVHKVNLKNKIDEALKKTSSYSRQLYRNSKMREAVNAKEYGIKGLEERQKETLQKYKMFTRKLLKYMAASSLYQVGVVGSIATVSLMMGNPLPATALLATGALSAMAMSSRILEAKQGIKEALDVFAMTHKKFKSKFKDLNFGKEKVERDANMIVLDKIAYQHRVREGESQGQRSGEDLFTSNEQFTIGRGITLLSGASGAGKSTLINLLLHSDNVTQGGIRIGKFNERGEFEGKDYKDLAAGAPMSNIAVSFQRPEMIDCTVDEYIRLGNPQADERHVAEVKKLLGIGKGEGCTLDDEKQLGAGVNISGGEQSRLGLAQALIKDSPIMILDEPTSGVDETMSANIVNHIAKLKESKTVVYITHDAKEIGKIGAYQALDIGKELPEDKINTMVKYDLTNQAEREAYIKFFTNRRQGRSGSNEVKDNPVRTYLDAVREKVDNRIKFAQKDMWREKPIDEKALATFKKIKGKNVETSRQEAGRVIAGFRGRE